MLYDLELLFFVKIFRMCLFRLLFFRLSLIFFFILFRQVQFFLISSLYVVVWYDDINIDMMVVFGLVIRFISYWRVCIGFIDFWIINMFVECKLL